jgi:DNA-binding NarL/FixJ family response regulator
MPVILVTGQPSFGSAVESLNLGVTGYLVKPFEFPELLAVVEKSLAQVRAQRRIRGIGRRLRQLTSDIDTIGDIQPGGAQMGLAESTEHVLELAFDGVAGILLDLKQELIRSTSRGTLQDSKPPCAGRCMASLTTALSNGSPQIKSLSPREREVLLNFLSGNRVTTIASELFISEHTVRNHLKSIFAKLGVGSQVELLERFKNHSSD